jgi:hypothetical protein
MAKRHDNGRPRRSHRIAIAGLLVGGLLGTGGAAADTSQTPQAGVAGAVVSPVKVAGAPRPEPMPVRTGMKMFLQDQISTGADARLQLMLLDETTFTVGPDSEVTIDKFVYDPSTGGGEVAAEITEGFMRYVSGKVGQNSPDNVEVDTPAATIGIRGTAFFVTSVPEQPDTFFAGLIGPGRQNNALVRSGGMRLYNDRGAVEVRRRGFGSYVTKGEAPEAPTRIPEALLARLHADLRPVRGGETDTARTGVGAGQAGVDPLVTSGQAMAESRQQTARETVRARVRREIESVLSQANLEANRIPSERDELAGPQPTPRASIDIPFFAELGWDSQLDLDLHATGPNPGRAGRYHVYFATPSGPLSGNLPVAELDQDTSGAGSSEVITVNVLPDNGPTRLSVFNFGEPEPGSTSLAESDAIVSLLRGGRIRRGPGGSVVVDGQVIDQVSPPAGAAGNTFVAFEIGPDGAITRVREMRDFPNPVVVE